MAEESPRAPSSSFEDFDAPGELMVISGDLTGYLITAERVSLGKCSPDPNCG
jgi:hypothetical protein